MNKKDLQLINTYSACPEQYDVMLNDKRVGYIRYRWGYLACYPCNKNEDIDWDNVIYNWESSDGYAGILNDDEKCHLDAAIEALEKYYNKNNYTDIGLFDDNGRADVGLTCPFCGDKIYIQVCDDEGNQHDKIYLEDQWSGLSFALVHGDADVECPINNEEMIGEMLYDSIDEAINIWNKRV